MSNRIIDLTSVNLIGCTKPKIEYSHTKKTTKTSKRETVIEETKVICYIDPKRKLSAESLKKTMDYHRDQYDTLMSSRKSHVDHRVQSSMVKVFLDSISDSQRYMLITWTFPKMFGKKYEEVLKDVFAIRSRIIKLFYPAFKPSLNSRPSDCPKMFFFVEKHRDGQFHIHLLMETIEPKLLAICHDRTSFSLKWHVITSKINKRRPSQKMVITQKMIDRWGDYRSHPYANKTFDQIKSNYDDWKVARFICDYISHYQEDERWGLNRISNSPENNHSKVIESKPEIHSKCSYLNKDRYFMDKDDDFLRHMVPEYSDF